MTNEELVTLIQNGDREKLGDLYQQNKGMIYTFCRRYGGGEELEDLAQECFFAVETAARLYDPGKEASFTTYLGIWLKQTILRYRMNLGGIVRVPVGHRERIMKYKRFMNDFRTTLGRDPSSAETIVMLQLTPDQIGQLQQDVKLLDLYSLNDLIGEETELNELIPDSGDLEEDVTDKILQDELRQALEQAIDALKEKEAAVIRARFFDNRIQKEIGEELRVNCSYVGALERSALRKLRGSRLLREYAKIYGISFKGTLSRFRSTGISVTEYAALRLYEMR